MADTDQNVANWFAANPNASLQDAVAAGEAVGINASQAQNYYNQYAPQASPLSSAPAAVEQASPVGASVTPASSNYFNASAAAPAAPVAPPSPLQSVVDKWITDNPTATPQQLADAVKSAGGLTPELASILATKYGTDVNTIQNSYNSLTQQPAAPAAPTVDFQSQIATQNPDAYNQIKNLSMFTANENFGGKVQDYQVQLFTPLDTTKVGVPKQLEFEPVKTEIVGLGQDGEQQIQTGGGLKSAGVTPIGGEETESGRNPITGYESTTPVNINGVPVFARYDAAGQLTGYVGDRRVTTWLDGKNRVVGNWDAEGNPNPSTMTSSGGGFVKGLGKDVTGFTNSLGPMAQIGLAVATGGLSLPEQLAANAAYQIASGAKAGDVLKGALGTYAGAELLGSGLGQDAAKGLNTIDPSGILSKTASGAVLGGLKGAATGQDFTNSLVAGATSGGISGVTSALTSNVPGFSDLSKTAQKAINTGVAGLLSGKPLDQATLGAAMSYASGEAKKAYKDSKTSDATDTTMPGGLQLAQVSDGNTRSDAGNSIVSVGGPVIYAGTPGSDKVQAPIGYQLMSVDDPANDQKTIYTDPDDPYSGQYKPDGSFFDVTQNAWFKPTGELTGVAEGLNNQLQGVGLPEGYGTDVTNLDRTGGQNGVSGTSPYKSTSGPLTTVGDQNVPEITITAPRESVDLDPLSPVVPTDVGPLGPVTPVVIPDPKIVVDPSNPSVKPPIQSVQPKTPATVAPLSAAAQAIPKLDSSPQGLTSTVQRDKKILKELTMLFGTLTPELVSALEDRGIRVPEVPKEKPEDKPEEPETEKQLAEDRALETKFAAAGGEITSKIDPKISYTPAGMLPAAQVIEQQSRLGALRHLREGLSNRPAGGLAQGGLPKKYADATPDGHKPEFITGLTGYYASGAGTGQSDDIDAMLHDGDYVADADLVAALGDGSSKAGAEALEKFRRSVPHKEGSQGGAVVPAKIADGEYVFPASFVTAIGQGDNKAGAKILDKMREAIRAHKRSAPTSKIPPKAKSPLDYLKMVKG